VHHSGLALRAASLAIGGLAALPFLDPCSFQRPASRLRVNSGSQQAAAISVMSQQTALIGKGSPHIQSAMRVRPVSVPQVHPTAARACYAVVLISSHSSRLRPFG
jgi:hypothetical protein